jgi:hypothetical protein
MPCGVAFFVFVNYNVYDSIMIFVLLVILSILVSKEYFISLPHISMPGNRIDTQYQADQEALSPKNFVSLSGDDQANLLSYLEDLKEQNPDATITIQSSTNDTQ